MGHRKLSHRVVAMRLVIALACLSVIFAYETQFTEEQHKFIEGTTALKEVVKMATENEAELARQIAASPLAAIFPNSTITEMPLFNVDADAAALPLVVAHGMGDSCFNPGMKSVTQAAGNQLTDTIDGFLLNMDKSVEAFKKRVDADPKLKNGFDAFGLSQGNNVIRGYITKYNNPPVRNFM